MKLTRRDALMAVAGTGIGIGGGAILSAERLESERGSSPSGSVSASKSKSASKSTSAGRGVPTTFVAVARAIYPSALTGIEGFVRTYVSERTESDERRSVVRETVRDLDAFAQGRHGASIADLDPGTVETLLKEIGVDTTAADPSDTIAGRVRYHVVNELQYALYASPTGGTLAGIENPIGHPGGIESYQQGPSA